MTLSHTDEKGRTFALADGDQTVASLLAAAGLDIFSGCKSIEIRCETNGPIAVAVNTVMTALTDGKQLAGTDDTVLRSVRYEQKDTNHVHIFAVGTADKVYIEVSSF